MVDFARAEPATCVLDCGKQAECKLTNLNTPTCTCSPYHSGSIHGLQEADEQEDCVLNACDHTETGCSSSDVVDGSPPDNCVCVPKDLSSEASVGTVPACGSLLVWALVLSFLMCN